MSFGADFSAISENVFSALKDDPDALCDVLRKERDVYPNENNLCIDDAWDILAQTLDKLDIEFSTKLQQLTGLPGQAHIKDQSEREKIFSLKESLRAALKRFLLMLSLDLSLLRRLRETCRMILKFAGESPLRMRQSSSLNVTSSTQWSEFSIPQCARTA